MSGYIKIIERVRFLKLRYDAMLRLLLKVDPGSWEKGDLGSQIAAAVETCDLVSVKKLLQKDGNYHHMSRDEIRSLARMYRISIEGKTKPELIKEIKHVRQVRSDQRDTRGNGQVAPLDGSLQTASGVLCDPGSNGGGTDRVPAGSFVVDPTHLVNDLRRLADDQEATVGGTLELDPLP